MYVLCVWYYDTIWQDEIMMIEICLFCVLASDNASSSSAEDENGKNKK